MTESVVNIRDFNAKGNDSTDDRAAIQEAILEADTAGLPVFVPAGQYRIGGSLIPSAGTVLQGARPGGFGSGTQPAPTSVSSIVALAGMNQPLIYGKVGAGQVRIRDLHLDGNKNNNTATSGIYITPVTVAAEEAGWHVESVFIEACAREGVYIGQGRRAVKIERSQVLYSGTVGIDVRGSDAGISTTIVGVSGAAGVRVDAPITRVTGCDIFGNLLGVEIPSMINMVSLTDNGIDKNARQGVYIGPNGYNISLVGNMFHSNSASANNSYHDIHVASPTAAGAVAVLGNKFGIDGGINNRPGYAVYAEAPGPGVKAFGNLVQSGATRRGFSNISGI